MDSKSSEKTQSKSSTETKCWPPRCCPSPPPSLTISRSFFVVHFSAAADDDDDEMMDEQLQPPSPLHKHSDTNMVGESGGSHQQELLLKSWCNSIRPWRPLGKLLDLYVLPIVCIAGLTLSIACIVVFTRRRSHPLVPVLIVLSFCDSLQLLFSMFVLYVPALHDHLEMDQYGWMAQLAYLATGMLAGGLLASNCASIWTMCYISVQRHQAIVRPLSTVSASRRYNYLPLCLIALASILFNLPIWFEFTWWVDYIPVAVVPSSAANAAPCCTALLRFGGNKTTHVSEKQSHFQAFIKHNQSALSTNPTYHIMMHKVLYPITVYLVPLAVITVLNLRILSNISASRIESVGHKHRMEKERRSVFLLISIVLLFFVCHAGGLALRFVDLHEYANKPCFVFAKDFSNFMNNLNSFANPMLYFFFTKQFKDLRTSWAASLLTASQAGSSRRVRSHHRSISQTQYSVSLGDFGGATTRLVSSPQQRPLLISSPKNSPFARLHHLSIRRAENGTPYAVDISRQQIRTSQDDRVEQPKQEEVETRSTNDEERMRYAQS